MTLRVLEPYGPPKPDAFTLVEAMLRRETQRVISEAGPEMMRRIARGECAYELDREFRLHLHPIHTMLAKIAAHRPPPPVMLLDVTRP